MVPIDLHTGHRLSFQGLRCPQERSPVRSHAVVCSPADRLRADQISGRSSDQGINIISHHAPSITGERVTDAQDFVLKISAFVSE